MRILFLIVAFVWLVMGMMVSPYAQGRAGGDEDLRYESLAKPVGVWAQRRMQAEAAIRAQIYLFTSAFNERDAQRLAALYTRDAVLLAPTQAQIEGRDKITQFWQKAIGAGLEDLVLAPVEIVVMRYMAYEIRTLTLSVPTESGEHRPVETKAIVVWQEDADGVWRLYRDIWTVMPPMPPLEEQHSFLGGLDIIHLSKTYYLVRSARSVKPRPGPLPRSDPAAGPQRSSPSRAREHRSHRSKDR